METIVKKIEDWSNAFHAPILNEIGRPNNNRIHLAYNLIQEELKEIADELFERNEFGFAIKSEIDSNKLADALGDTLWVVIRAMMEFGFSPEEVITKIYNSNMSKLCYTQEEAEATVLKYKEQGIEAEWEVVNRLLGRYVVINKATKKILKSINFQEPDFNYPNI